MLHSLITLLPISPIIRAVISCVLFIGIAFVLYETTISSAIYSSLIFVALAVISEYVCLVALNILGFDTGAQMVGGNARAINLLLAKTIHFIVVLIASAVLRKNRATLSLRQILPLLPCFIVIIYICIVFFSLFADHEETISSMLLVSLIGLMYINGIIILNTQSIKNAIIENEAQTLAQEHYEIQMRYYRNVLRDREETRALWHDLKKHVTAMEALVFSKEQEFARNEYEQISLAFENLGSIVDTENTTINAILHHNIERAKSHNIPVRLDAHVASELPVSAVDLSVIIGNTFDNAIEECITLDDIDQGICVTLVQQNNMLFYEISNPCLRISRKKAGKFRGYGLRNVRRCVGMYNGSMENGIQDDQYIVSIRLNFTEDSDIIK